MEQSNINNNEEEMAIDLGELLLLLWSKAHIILLSGIVIAMLTFIGTKVFITPQYSSITKMYVLSRQDTTSVTASDLATGTQLTKDYMELVKSRSVLEQVIAVLNLDMTTEELSDKITVATPLDTRILSITVMNEDPKIARDTADALREAVTIKIMEVMDIDSVNTVEEASLPTKPTTPSVMKNSVIGGFIGIFVVIGIIFLIFFFDDTIKSPDDVEHYLGMNVLASLPIKEGTAKNKKAKGLSKKTLKHNFESNKKR